MLKELNSIRIYSGYLISKGLMSIFPFAHQESSQTFQLRTLFDVIEHLPNINSDLNKLSEILDQKGSIAIITPDINSLQRKLFGKRWFQFKPKEHIYYFSSKTLEQAVKPYGLKIVHISSCGQYADLGFIYHRLRRYDFTKISSVLKKIMKISFLKNRSLYINTGSMLVILQKSES